MTKLQKITDPTQARANSTSANFSTSADQLRPKSSKGPGRIAIVLITIHIFKLFSLFLIFFMTKYTCFSEQTTKGGASRSGCRGGVGAPTQKRSGPEGGRAPRVAARNLAFFFFFFPFPLPLTCSLFFSLSLSLSGCLLVSFFHVRV